MSICLISSLAFLAVASPDSQEHILVRACDH